MLKVQLKMAVTYCTAADVASICQFLNAKGDARAIFGTDPIYPSLEEVEDMINEAEEWINETCQTAWGALFLSITDELHDIHVDHTESSIHLNYGDVIDFTTGDKLEIWDGAAWIDWIATYVEGRNNDFFVDYVMGKIYLMKRFHRLERLNAKVTYRVRANSTIPRTIKFSSAYLVGINILNSEYASVSFPSGEGEELTKQDVMNRWWRLVTRKLRPYTKAGLITGTPFEPVR